MLNAYDLLARLTSLFIRRVESSNATLPLDVFFCMQPMSIQQSIYYTEDPYVRVAMVMVSAGTLLQTQLLYNVLI